MLPLYVWAKAADIKLWRLLSKFRKRSVIEMLNPIPAELFRQVEVVGPLARFFPRIAANSGGFSVELQAFCTLGWAAKPRVARVIESRYPWPFCCVAMNRYVVIS